MSQRLRVSQFALAAAAGMACLFISDNSSSILQSSLVTQADARVGNPLTPVSVAGVERRQTRRAVRRGAVVTGAAVGTGAYYRGYYGPGYSGTGYSGTGYYGTGYSGTGYSGPASASLTREQAVRTCVAQAQSQAPGTPLTSDIQRQRGGLYLSCMYSMGQRP
jgi:hypothetical protein